MNSKLQFIGNLFNNKTLNSKIHIVSEYRMDEKHKVLIIFFRAIAGYEYLFKILSWDKIVEKEV